MSNCWEGAIPSEIQSRTQLKMVYVPRAPFKNIAPSDSSTREGSPSACLKYSLEEEKCILEHEAKALNCEQDVISDLKEGRVMFH